MVEQMTTPDDEVLPDGRIKLETEVALPDVLDVLIAGGGPAGTATAFRARELKLSALVIELDDVLKRIRDYDARKPIKPDFGAAQQMEFPQGGMIVECLRFFTDIKGDDLCRDWKGLYRRFSVPVQVGVELVGLEPDDADIWRVRVRNHRTETDDVLRARHVVLALGAGMPRRLDVPGNVRAIAHRLSDATRYVGGPACVIGSGVSAVEAILAISGAKAASADETAVYWSHRGTGMAKAPQALVAALEYAISVNRNVQLLSGSEAREIADTDEGTVLRLQVARAGEAGRPAETSLLEFDVARVIACIGQEIDWSLINGIGIHPVAGGSRPRKAIPLNALMESRQPNVYVIGDTLNTAYFECDDFAGDSAKFREVKHRGNIKASLNDGVKVAEVIAQRLAGRTEFRVDTTFARVDSSASPAPPAAPGRGRLASRATGRRPDGGEATVAAGPFDRRRAAAGGARASDRPGCRGRVVRARGGSSYHDRPAPERHRVRTGFRAGGPACGHRAGSRRVSGARRGFAGRCLSPSHGGQRPRRTRGYASAGRQPMADARHAPPSVAVGAP